MSLKRPLLALSGHCEWVRRYAVSEEQALITCSMNGLLASVLQLK